MSKRLGAAALPRLLPSAALGALLLLSACTSSVPEPEAAFTPIGTHTHAFQAVFEGMASAIQSQGFVVVDDSRKEGERAELRSDLKVIKTDPVSKREDARRVRLRMQGSGKSYAVEVAASKFTRTPPTTEWSYEGQDEALRAKVKAGLEEALRARYRKGE